MAYLQNNDPTRPDGCVFCAKVDTDDDAAEHVLYRGEYCFVTLNLFPYNNGHLMVVPYQHVGDLTLLEDPALDELMEITQGALRVPGLASSPLGWT